MRCQEAKQYIHSHLDGQLTGTQQKALYRHLSACPSCQKELNVVRRVNKLLDESCTPVEPPASFTSMVMRQIPGAPEVETCPAQKKRKRVKKGFSPGSWLNSMLDMETRALLAMSYFVIFVAIGVLFAYGSNQLNALTPLQQGNEPEMSGKIFNHRDDEQKPQEDTGDDSVGKDAGVKDRQNPPARSVVPTTPDKSDSSDAGNRLQISDNPDFEPVSPTVILTSVVTDTKLMNIHPVWGKDGKIFYLSRRKTGEERYTVWETSPDGRDSKMISSGGYGLPVLAGGGVWSPDRSEIAYVTRRNGYLEIWVDDLAGNGTDLTIDTTGKAIERAKNGEDLWAYNPVWSSQGEIAYLTTRSDNVDIMAINTDGINRVVTMTPAVETNPAWSPDGEKIAYFRSMTGEEGETTNEIYVVNKDGSNPQRVTSGFAAKSMVPAWHPNGKMLAVNVGKTDEQSRDDKGIWLVNLETGANTQLTKTGGGRLVSWAPDGSKLAFTDTDGVLHVLYLKDDLTVQIIYKVVPGTGGQKEVWVDWADDSQRLLFDWDNAGTARGIWIATLPAVNAERQAENQREN